MPVCEKENYEMRHTKSNGRVLFVIDKSSLFCSHCVVHCIQHVSISNPVSRPKLIMWQDGKNNHLPFVMAAVDKVLTQSLPTDIRFMQCVICSSVFLCYFSSVRCREVIAFALSSQWETLIWCFCPMRPVQILAFVSSNVTSNDCCRCLQWTGCWTDSCKLKCDCYYLIQTRETELITESIWYIFRWGIDANALN